MPPLGEQRWFKKLIGMRWHLILKVTHKDLVAACGYHATKTKTSYKTELPTSGRCVLCEKIAAKENK